jgi:hypothetical protein
MNNYYHMLTFQNMIQLSLSGSQNKINRHGGQLKTLHQKLDNKYSTVK